MPVSLMETALSVIQNDHQWLLVRLGIQSAAFAACAIAISRREPSTQDVGFVSFLAVAGLLLTGTVEELTIGRRDDFTRLIDCLSSNLSTLALAYAALAFANRGEAFLKATTLFWLLTRFYSVVAGGGEKALRVAEAADAGTCLLAGLGFAIAISAKVKDRPVAYGLTLLAAGSWSLLSYLYWYPEWYPEWFEARHWAIPTLKVSLLSSYAATVMATIFVTRRPPNAVAAYVNYGVGQMHAG